VTRAVLPFRSAGEIGVESLTEALRRAGLHPDGAAVEAVDAAPIGTGQMADSLRLTITWSGDPSDAPRSLVAKLPSSDERSRATGRIMRAYEVEVSFYREVAPLVDIRTPRCLLAELDQDTNEFLLLLEDLAPASQGDQLDGCGADLAARVLDEAAALHAPRWNDPGLRRITWLDRVTPESAAATASVVGSLFPGFVDRYGHSFAPEVIDGLERGVERIGEWWRGLPGAQTVVHGDLRLDNLLLGDEADAIWTVDWQTVVLGNGVADTAYFVGGNLLPEERRRHEQDLVRGYHRSLLDRGVEGLSWDECWARYRHGAWHGVYLSIAASMLVEQTERGDRMFTTNTDRHVRHALDLEAFDVFDLYDRGFA
jgi:hypothetical protein